MKISSFRVLMLAGAVSLMSVATSFSAGQCTGNAKDIVDTAVAAGSFQDACRSVDGCRLGGNVEGHRAFHGLRPD